MPAAATGEPDSPPELDASCLAPQPMSEPAGSSAFAVEIVVADERWRASVDLDLLQRCADAAVHSLGGTAALALDGDQAIMELNERFRGKPAATNVLSFPSGSPAAPTSTAARFLGDVILAYETMLREAAEAEIPLTHHACHLAVHGILHLSGYDHATDAEAERMERAEVNLLAQFSIPDPYADGEAQANSP